MKKAWDVIKRLTRMQQEIEQTERYSFNPILHWNPEVEDYFIKAYGPHHFSLISSALTHPSSYSCVRVNTLETTTDSIIEKLSLLLQETNNFQNSQYDPIIKCQVPGLENVVFVEGSGPHSINYGYVPDESPPKEILVSRKCAEAVLRGAQVYVPGVLACSAHVEEGDTVAVSVAVEQPSSDGKWGVGITRGTVLQGLQTDPQYFERKGMYIGQGTAMLSRAGMFRVLQGIAVEMTNRVFQLPSFHNVLEGEIFLQNLPSIITTHALDPQQGERILDMCAAPGGKTTAIAMLMKDKGELIAVDRSHNKVIEIQSLASEMGLTCIKTYRLDSSKAVFKNTKSKNVTPNGSVFTCNENVSCDEENKDIQRKRNGPGRGQTKGGRVEKSEGFLPNSFDRVLLDAPCSALGLRPRLFAGEETLKSLRSDGRYQRKMFDQAVQLVRSGGVIVYSTCTINPGENEALVRYALDTYKFLCLSKQHPRIGGPGLVGGFEYDDGYVEEWLKPGEEELVQRFDPSSSLDTIGFFIAKFDVGSKDVV